MAKSLVIVESPAKAKTIAGFLGERLHGARRASGTSATCRREQATQVPDDKKETHGRLAGIDPDDHFDVVYVVHDDKKKVVAELKAALKGADELILATDEDREGEAIGWHVLEVLAAEGARCGAWCSTRSRRSAIREALDNPRELDMKLVEAQEGRRILDRLVGWETSPVLWRVFGRGQAASAGRVQSVAVRMVVERERARMRVPLRAVERPRSRALRATIRRSAPSLVELDGRRLAEGRDFDPATGQLAAGGLERRQRRRRAARTPAEADALAEPLPRRAVHRRVGGDRRRSPSGRARRSRPRRSQQESGRKLRFGAARTMSIAQRLYERGYITYMRTDSTNLSEQAITAARTAIREQYGEEYLPAEPRAYRSKVKNAQEAHEAIRPAGDRIRRPDEVRDRARRRRAASLRADLDPHGRVPDDATRAAARSTIRVTATVDRERDARRSAPRARRTTSSAGAACTSKTSTRARSRRTKPACPRSSKASASTCNELVPGRRTRRSRPRATPRRAS